MTSIEPFQLENLLDANSINLDPLTENFNLSFYTEYLNSWPDLFFTATEPYSGFGKTKELAGYMMGKTEGQLMKKEWHTHITAVTVQDTYRRLGLASDMCIQLENLTSVPPHSTWFVDLFVKVTNSLARKMYEKLGYSVYRRVVGYYGRVPLDDSDRNKINDDVDAFDMRKSLPADIKNETIRDNGEKHYVLPQEIVF
ncbi:N-terminal acetyltransferase B complex catalytic subunit Nat3p [Diutina catenulata]